ncbi:MAG TPA: sulfotransferase [Acidimicrobiales bacterium]|nr:sulfotransferase [Acidimicrobiales bacterium]
MRKRPGLRVIGAGLGRTGTASLKLALEELLGGTCYHLFEVATRPDDPDVWADAYEGVPPDWPAFFAGYTATLGWPSAPLWPELSDAFPDAPIVLSVRDADSWWRSVSQTVLPAMAGYFEPDAPDDGWTRMGRAILNRLTPQWRDETSAKAAFAAYNEHVRATAPPSRLVEWRPGDGWGPLCAALGLTEPGHPFPHANTMAEARAELGLGN